MRKIFHILILVTLTLMLQGCVFDDYDHCDIEYSKVWVDFDMSQCNGQEPGGMSVFLFPKAGGRPRRFEFIGSQGDYISIAPGEYSLLSYNSDTYRVVVDDYDSYDKCSFTTPSTTVFAGIGSLTRAAIPGGPPEGEETIRKEPQQMWRGYISNVTVPPARSDTLHITVPVVTTTAKVTVNIGPCTNLDDISQLCGILTGTPSVQNALTLKPEGQPAAIPFSINRPNAKSDMLTGNFRIFTKTGFDRPSWLILYIWLRDGQKYYYKFDVTQMMAEAPDQKNIILDLGPITVPISTGPDTPGGGMDVGVDGWDYVIIDITT